MAISLLTSVAQAAIDASPSSSVLLNESGRILTTNMPWREFGRLNGGTIVEHDVGENYLAVCDEAIGTDSEGAAKMAEGIRSVIRGSASRFLHVYACNSPTEERWFIARVSRVDDAGQVRILISHEDISGQRK